MASAASQELEHTVPVPFVSVARTRPSGAMLRIVFEPEKRKTNCLLKKCAILIEHSDITDQTECHKLKRECRIAHRMSNRSLTTNVYADEKMTYLSR